MNTVRNYLILYLHDHYSQADSICKKLPLYHTRPFKVARDFIFDRKLTLEPCDVFDENLIYLFLGKAGYREENTSDLELHQPISFVINPEAISFIERVYPFDTGAAFKGKYDEVFDIEDLKELKIRYLLGNTLHNAYSLIKILYGSSAGYIKNEPLSIIPYDHEIAIEMDSIKKIHSETYRVPDQRKTIIEVQVSQNIEFNNNTLLKILAPGVVHKNYDRLNTLLNDLRISTMITPDHTPLLETFHPKKRTTSSCYTEIWDDSIKISADRCHTN